MDPQPEIHFSVDCLPAIKDSVRMNLNFYLLKLELKQKQNDSITRKSAMGNFHSNYFNSNFSFSVN